MHERRRSWRLPCAALAALALSACGHEEKRTAPAADGAFARALTNDPGARAALARFSVESTPALDACIGAINTPRAAARVLVGFERVPARSSDAPPIFVASSFRSIGDATALAELDNRGVACLDKLRGLPLRLPDAVAHTAPAAFVQPVVMAMPTAFKGGAR